MVPPDVTALVDAENAALAKEIDDQRNKKFCQELKTLYCARWQAYKNEFYQQSAKPHLKCLGQSLYLKNEIQLLKKLLLAECYKITAEGSQHYVSTIE